VGLANGSKDEKVVWDLYANKKEELSKLAAQISLGKKLQPLAYHAQEITFQWPLDGDLKLGFASPKMLPKIVGDLLNPKIKKNIYMNV
jgi:hypothetical protein